VLRENGIVPDHRHNWIFAGGSGNFMLCAIGRGRHLVSATKSEEFASLVLLLHENQQTEFRDRIVTGVFDPYRSHIFHSVSYLNPPGKLSGTELQQWVDEQSEYLDAELAAYE
jgi:hypothetical protein